MKKNGKTTFSGATRIAVTLLFLLVTTTSAWALEGHRMEFVEKSEDPIGYLDKVETYACCIHVAGWTCDPYMYVWKTWEAKNWAESYEDHTAGLYGYKLPDKHNVCNDNTSGEIAWWMVTLLSKSFHSAQQNKVEIHLQQNGEDKHVFTYDMNTKRNDAKTKILSQNNYYDDTTTVQRNFPIKSADHYRSRS